MLFARLALCGRCITWRRPTPSPHGIGGEGCSVAEATRNYLSLFVGYGGLDVAIRAAAPGARCVGYVEREAAAAGILAARMADGGGGGGDARLDSEDVLRNPLTDPQPGDVIEITPGWTRTVTKRTARKVWFDGRCGENQALGIPSTLANWRSMDIPSTRIVKLGKNMDTELTAKRGTNERTEKMD